MAVVLVVALAGAALFALFLQRRLVRIPWTEDWIPPPGFGEMVLDLSSGRAEEGEKKLDAIFARYRSPLWVSRARLLLGVARLRRREFVPALKALDGAGPSDGSTRDFLSLKKAEALIGVGRPREAADLLERLARSHSDPTVADDAAIVLARALTADGDRSGARRALAAHLASRACRDRAEVLQATAQLAEDDADPAAAADAYRRIFLEEARAPEASHALERLTALVPAPRRFALSDIPRVAARARTLIDAGDGRGALTTWDLFLTSLPSAASDPRVRFGTAEAALSARQLERARLLLGTGPVARGDSQRAWLLGRLLLGLGRDNEALSALRRGSEGSTPSAGEALFLLATTLDQSDHDREALGLFLRYTREFASGDKMANALWRAGWLSWRLGRRQDARQCFSALLRRPADAAWHPSALYWLARVDEAEGRRSQAIETYTKLVGAHARDYYGLLAARRLNPSSPLKTPRGAAPQPTDPSRDSERLGQPPRGFCEAARDPAVAARVRCGCELETIGLFQDAEREYESAAAAGPERSLLLRLSEIAIRRGDRSAAISRLKAAVPGYLGVDVTSLPMRYWEILYPRREWEAIEAVSKGSGLDPDLVCGLILQESAFNPIAVSGAGAMGLMQVLPSTAHDAALALGLRDFASSRLLEPATNLRVGTWHLSGLLTRFGGRMEMALAAYNAGEARIRHWQTLYPGPDPTFFIEEVPFTETRLYVKRILSHAAMYRAIYGRE